MAPAGRCPNGSASNDTCLAAHNKTADDSQGRPRMQYLFLLYANEGGWQQLTEAQKQQGMAAYTAYTQALKKEGVWVGSNRLQPIAAATTVRVTDGKSQVLDGPYADTKEQLGGYYLVEVPDLD